MTTKSGRTYNTMILRLKKFLYVVYTFLKLMRVKHYIKNVLIFAPLVFSGNLFNINLLLRTAFGFVSFSLLASTIYILNDIKDLEYDKLHPIKKYRPLASGEIKQKQALKLSIILFIAAGIINNYFINTTYSFIYLLVYLILNLSYSLGLKNVPLVDILIIVFGYILRVVYGGEINAIIISPWMYLSVMSLSFYLAFGKRRNEIKKNGNSARTVLKYYNESFLDKNMYMCLTLTIIFYSLWCVSPNDIINNTSILMYTIPLVIIICIKYSMNIEGDSYGDPADVLLNDKVLMSLVTFYGVILTLIIYWFN